MSISNSTIRFDGAEELLAKFKAMTDVARRDTLSGAVNPAAEIVRDAISENAPQLTGKLAYNIETVPLTDSADRFVTGIQVNSQSWYWRFLEFGTVHAPPHPFIRAAFKRIRSVARSEIQGGIRDQVEGFRE